MPRIVPANPTTIAEAAQVLRNGGVIAFPTETVYGLGALTFDERAIERVYEMKGRPTDNPLIAHVLDARHARKVIAHEAWNADCDALASRFWPGPLTLVLNKSERVGDRATAGRSTIAVRSPRQEIARALIEATGSPISAPSANRSGRVSPTSAPHVMDEFADVDAARDLIILDGGSCEVGIESTVLDMTVAPTRILRHGSVTLEQLRDVLGEVDAQTIRAQAESPGTAESHYAPRTPTALVTSEELPQRLQTLSETGSRHVVLCFDAHDHHATRMTIIMPRDADRYAHDLYQRLRDADAVGACRIVIERPPDDSHLWRAVIDRVRRATALRC